MILGFTAGVFAGFWCGYLWATWLDALYPTDKESLTVHGVPVRNGRQ